MTRTKGGLFSGEERRCNELLEGSSSDVYMDAWRYAPAARDAWCRAKMPQSSRPQLLVVTRYILQGHCRHRHVQYVHVLRLAANKLSEGTHQKRGDRPTTSREESRHGILSRALSLTKRLSKSRTAGKRELRKIQPAFPVASGMKMHSFPTSVRHLWSVATTTIIISHQHDNRRRGRKRRLHSWKSNTCRMCSLQMSEQQNGGCKDHGKAVCSR